MPKPAEPTPYSCVRCDEPMTMHERLDTEATPWPEHCHDCRVALAEAELTR